MATITYNTTKKEAISFTIKDPSESILFLKSSKVLSYSVVFNNQTPVIVNGSTRTNIAIPSNGILLNCVIEVINGDTLSDITGIETYSSFTEIEITTAMLATMPNLQELSLFNGSNHNVIGNIADLSATITQLIYPNTLVGSISDFKNTVKRLDLRTGPHTKVVTGIFSDLPTDLEFFSQFTNPGEFVITGNSIDLPVGLTYLEGRFDSGVTINFDELPSPLQYINLTYNSANLTITGSINALPLGLVSIFISGAGTCNVTGDVANLPTTLDDFSLESATDTNTITGNVDDLLLLRTLKIFGNNTISGNTNNLPISLVTLSLEGANTLTGLIENIPLSITNFNVKGNNTISGDIGFLNNSFYTFQLTGLNTVSGFTVPTNIFFYNFSNFRFILDGNNTLSSTEVDDLLIKINNQIIRTGAINIIIVGNSGIRTSASDTAYNAMIARGFNITLNT